MQTTRKGRVLIIDDSPVVRENVATVAREIPEVGYVDEASDGFEALQVLRGELPDLIVCDLEMPRCGGLQFLRLRSQIDRLGHIPVLILTSHDGPAQRIELFDAGASDFVQKPWVPQELAARLRVHLRAKMQRDELAKTNARLEEMTCRDALTGVHNRRHFDLSLSTELAKVDRMVLPLSLVMVDIDHFKRVNDELGHPEGDAVLRSTAGLLQRSVRATDVVSRYGGEEFVVLLPGTAALGARLLAERLRGRMASFPFFVGDDARRLTASFGVATVVPGAERVDAALLIRRADNALYEAKRAGRNRVLAWENLRRTTPAEGSPLLSASPDHGVH